MSGDTTPPVPIEQLVRACRTALGDELRSVVYFTTDAFEQVYLREDLDAEADLRAFVENERVGFARRPVESELGPYEYTIHSFERGFLTRVVEGDRGVFVTTDDMSTSRIDELVAAIEDVLDDEE